MKLKNEKGVINIDYATAIIILMLGSIAVLAMYLGIYKTMAKTKIDEAIIGYVTEICETIDLRNYEDVDTKEEINQLIQTVKIPSNYNVVCENIIKYAEENSSNQDVVEKVNLRIKYTVDNTERDFTISKMKVKE